jgi:CRP/FNR family transcriptional regulator, anaerobic regulatory protein
VGKVEVSAVSGSRYRNIVNISQLRKACRSCSLRDLCLPVGLATDDVERLESIVHTRGPMDRGAHLFREGDRFEAIFAVRSGALKTYHIDTDGREHVLGFHLPGELLGLDAIYPQENRCSAQTLEQSYICVLPFNRLEALAQEVPGLQSQILRLMSKDLSVSSERATDHTAEEKLAGFLLGLSMRSGGRADLTLVMPRRDIASYLRLATETVSRLFARFQKKGLISVRRKRVELLDVRGLEEIGGNCDIAVYGGYRQPASR